MKKILVTILSLSYLYGGFGLASLSHFCSMKNQAVENIADSCCTQPAHNHCPACGTEEKQPATHSACCAAETDEKPASDIFSDVYVYTHDCCETTIHFSRVEESSIVKVVDQQIDLAQAATFSCNLFCNQLDQDEPATTAPATLASRLNLPLLI